MQNVYISLLVTEAKVRYNCVIIEIRNSYLIITTRKYYKVSVLSLDGVTCYSKD